MFCHQNIIVESRECAEKTARAESCRFRILPTTSCGPYPPKPAVTSGRGNGRGNGRENGRGNGRDKKFTVQNPQEGPKKSLLIVM